MSHRFLPRIVAFIGCVLGAAIPVGAQTTWYVDEDAPNDPGARDPTVSDPLENGSADHPFDAIQEGIDAAANGHIVLILDGTYMGTGNRDLDFGGKLITLRSANGPDNCIIDCQGSASDPHRGFYFHSGETNAAVVNGFTIRNGHVDANGVLGGKQGGAIHCDSSSPTISNCMIIGNTAFSGGGIWSRSSRARIAHCTVTWNTASSSGGLGGGVSTDAFDGAIANCTITGNVAYKGGGIWGNYFAGTVTNCTITRNSAWGYGNAEGGGIALYNFSNGVIANCSIVANTAVAQVAPSYGGGIRCFNSSPIIRNCTITGNRGGSGGALSCTRASPLIANSILNGNTPSEIYIINTSYPLITYSNVGGGWSGAGNISANPLFADPGHWDDNGTPNNIFDDIWVGGNYRLLSGSLCIDAADNTAVPRDTIDLDNDGDTSERIPLDLGGTPRFMDDPDTIDTGVPDLPAYPDVVDMGAYEGNCDGSDFDGDGWPDMCDSDIDDDGVLNDADICDYTPRGTAIDAEGRPLGDIDRDCDTDLNDHKLFQQGFTGPLR